MRNFSSFLGLTKYLSEYVDLTLFTFCFQISGGKSLYHLSLRYFDHLLQRNVSAAMMCENPAKFQHMTPISVICTKSDITVILPPKTRLHRLKALSNKPGIGTTLTKTTSHGEIVQILKISEEVRTFKKIRVTKLCTKRAD